MKAYYQDKWVTIYHGDSREAGFDGISAVVTDPPYELGFMGKSWDSAGVSFQSETWGIIRKMCLPGAPLLSFGGTRTFHRIACAIEDAGWEVRDTLAWVYGQGFPKSRDVSKAIDYDACREQLTERLDRRPTKEELEEAWGQFRQVVGKKVDISSGKAMSAKQAKAGSGKNINDGWDRPWRQDDEHCETMTNLTAPATPAAQLWEGYGTALKPAYEPIILAMNPLDGTFANNALKHGVAGLNIDECRIKYIDEKDKKLGQSARSSKAKTCFDNFTGKDPNYFDRSERSDIKGRFPANFIHDGSQMVLELFPDSKSTGGRSGHTAAYSDGSAARFFYCAKASKAERDRGLENMPNSQDFDYLSDTLREGGNRRVGRVSKNNHPTVKPLALMEYLVKLVKMPEHNLVLDPFMGSGTTLLACIRLGIPCIGIDNDEHSCEIAARRCSQEVMELG